MNFHRRADSKHLADLLENSSMLILIQEMKGNHAKVVELVDNI